MHTYPGINALTLTGSSSGDGVLPSTLVANTGVWSTAEVGDGGDPRSAADLFDAVEAAIDRTNFLAWRNINVVEGGNYSFTTTIVTRNIWNFANEVDLTGNFYLSGIGEIVAGTTLYVGDHAGLLGIGHVVVTNGSDITVTPGGAIKADGTGGGTAPLIEAINGGKILTDSSSTAQLNGQTNLAGPTTQSGSYTKSGAGAWEVERVTTILFVSNAATIAAPHNNDLYTIAPATTGSNTITVDFGTVQFAKLRIFMGGPNGPSGTITLNQQIGGSISDIYLCTLNSSGNQIGNTSGLPCAFVDLMWLGTGIFGWLVIGGFGITY